MKKLFSILFVCWFANVSRAQDIPIQTDRPDQTECPFIVPAYYLQLESGVALEKEKKGLFNYTHPTILWRYGLSNRFEVRLITDFISTKERGELSADIAPIEVGIKVNIFEEQKWIPVTSFIGHLTTPIGSKKFATEYTVPSFRFTMQHTLSPKMTLAYNLGGEWDGWSPNMIAIYTLTTGYSLTEDIGCFAEFYGFFRKNDLQDHRFDAGITYLVHNHLQLDGSAGFGLTADAARHFISAGLSYRFDAKSFLSRVK